MIRIGRVAGLPVLVHTPGGRTRLATGVDRLLPGQATGDPHDGAQAEAVAADRHRRHGATPDER